MIQWIMQGDYQSYPYVESMVKNQNGFKATSLTENNMFILME